MHIDRSWAWSAPPLAGAAAWLVVHARSPAVRAWRRPTMPTTRSGTLFARTGGTGDVGVLLLHGLVATGDVFAVSADHLAEHHRVTVPDLLGFGRSLDPSVADFGTNAHLDALSTVIDEQLGSRRIRIGAHSMGATLALRLATRLTHRIEKVVCVGAPIWRDPRGAIGAAGPMARAFLLDERVAGRICQWNCRHRWVSGWLAAAAAPRWPTSLARQASLHTWPAYRRTVEDQVLDVDWTALLESVSRARVPVTLLWGDRDPIGDPLHARRLVEDYTTIVVEDVSAADHTAPLSRPDILADRLATIDDGP